MADSIREWRASSLGLNCLDRSIPYFRCFRVKILLIKVHSSEWSTFFYFLTQLGVLRIIFEFHSLSVVCFFLCVPGSKFFLNRFFFYLAFFKVLLICIYIMQLLFFLNFSLNFILAMNKLYFICDDCKKYLNIIVSNLIIQIWRNNGRQILVWIQ